ncbi:helix-turn-helix domain-containing protein [Lapidilactobacillus salsurivasis]
MIRRLRCERGLTQAMLTQGICSRTTLSMFENGGTYLSGEILFQYLDRLNILPNEYVTLLLQEQASQGWKRIVDKEDQLLKVGRAIELGGARLARLRSEYWCHYQETRDVFYLYLLIRIQGAQTFQTRGQVVLSQELLTPAQAFLNQITVPHYFDLLLYTGILHTYSLTDIQHDYQNVLSHYTLADLHSPDQVRALFEYYVRLISLQITAGNWSGLSKYLTAFRELLTGDNRFYGSLLLQLWQQALATTVNSPSKPEVTLDLVRPLLTLLGIDPRVDPDLALALASQVPGHLSQTQIFPLAAR